MRLRKHAGTPSTHACSGSRADSSTPLCLCACRCLDLSSSRRKLALVDEANKVVVYDTRTKVCVCGAAAGAPGCLRAAAATASRAAAASAIPNCCNPQTPNRQELVFEEAGVNSACWNGHFEDMLCFSGGGQLFIKTGNFPLAVQKMSGFVVGFKVRAAW